MALPGNYTNPLMIDHAATKGYCEGVAKQMSLDHAVLQAMRAFNRVSERTWCVKPAVPILFFGDLDAYRASSLRVLMVGLNPSLREFPSDQPFRRFPFAEDSLGREPSRYLKAMSAYFRTAPYRR